MSIENVKGVEVSKKYFEGFLEENKMDYDEFITSIVIQEEIREKAKNKKKLIYDLVIKEYCTFNSFKKDLSILVNKKFSY